MAAHHSAPSARQDGVSTAEGKIRASHLLVKHRESRRPSSWREAEITRSKQEALEILRGHEAKIQSGAATLGDLAVSESDCSSARKRGDLFVASFGFYMISVLTMTLGGSSAMGRCKRSLKKLRLRSSLVKSAALLKPLRVYILLSGMLTLLDTKGLIFTESNTFS